MPAESGVVGELGTAQTKNTSMSGMGKDRHYQLLL